MFEANHIIAAMESFEGRARDSRVALVLAEAVNTCQRLSEMRGSSRLMGQDSRLLETTMDLIEAKLKSFGHSA